VLPGRGRPLARACEARGTTATAHAAGPGLSPPCARGGRAGRQRKWTGADLEVGLSFILFVLLLLKLLHRAVIRIEAVMFVLSGRTHVSTHKTALLSAAFARGAAAPRRRDGVAGTATYHEDALKHFHPGGMSARPRSVSRRRACASSQALQKITGDRGHAKSGNFRRRYPTSFPPVTTTGSVATSTLYSGGCKFGF
jgi:hypothetical protein